MGDEYVSLIRKGCLEDRWVDWSPNAGKRQGAFSTRVPSDTYPFIMMSYTDDIGSMSTLSHGWVTPCTHITPAAHNL